MDTISQDNVQAFLNKFRKGFYAFQEFGYCVAHNNQYEWKVKAHNWYTLLIYLADVHDCQEVRFLISQGIEEIDLP